MGLLTLNATPLFAPLTPPEVNACVDSNSLTLNLNSDDYDAFLEEPERYCAVAHRLGFDALLIRSDKVERRYSLGALSDSDYNIDWVTTAANRGVNHHRAKRYCDCQVGYQTAPSLDA